MGGTRLDDLARALAEPMPRRRALRFLGGSLAIAVLPGISPRPARAATRRASEHCGRDQRVCLKDTKPDGTREHYCCPEPSWRFGCGSRPAWRCVNTCPERGNLFPCTATENDLEAGINGQCCDRRIHVGCHEVGIEARRIKAGTCETCPPSRPAICIPYKRGKGECCRLSGEQCCANDESSACCGDDQTCVYPRKPNGSIDPEGQVSCRCKPGSGRACGPECCKRDERCTGTGCCPKSRAVCGNVRIGGKGTCCPEGQFCLWKRTGVYQLLVGECKPSCSQGNRCGTQCCGTGFRCDRAGQRCV